MGMKLGTDMREWALLPEKLGPGPWCMVCRRRGSAAARPQVGSCPEKPPVLLRVLDSNRASEFKLKFQ